MVPLNPWPKLRYCLTAFLLQSFIACFFFISPLDTLAQDKISDETAKALSQELAQKILSSLQSSSPHTLKSTTENASGNTIAETPALDALFLSSADLDWMMDKYKTSRNDLSPDQLAKAKKEMLERSSEARNSLQTLLGQTSNVELLDASGTYELNINWIGMNMKITTSKRTFNAKFAAIYNGTELKIVIAPAL